jgi:multiple sugar transport system permease protein
MMIVPIVVGYNFSMIYIDSGPLNQLLAPVLERFGVDPRIRWLSHPVAAQWAIILADVWQWTPFMFVILLAGLTAIPPNLYEAAELDGVGPWQVFWSITLPLLSPMIMLAITFRLLDAIRLFDTIFIMTGGGPGTQTYTASYYLYTVGFTQFHLSQATAGSWLFLIITALAVTFLVRRLLRVEKT